MRFPVRCARARSWIAFANRQCPLSGSVPFTGFGAEPKRAALEFTARSAFGADLMASVTLDSLDLAALLCSRVCHDVISPVGAIVNGLEVLEDENEASMREFALDLIRKSARQASARLQFARLAFGAAGSAGASIDLGDAEQVTKGMFTDDKVALSWEGPRALLPKNKVKLLLNLVVLATNAIPRGGAIAVKIAGDAAAAEFTLTAKGPNARIPAHVEGLLAGTPESGSVDAHAIQPFYTGLIAQAAGMPVTFSIEGDEVTIRAAPAA
jgi:histidine phosphotransferase ChpT